jgi:hypothetical protein
MATVLTVAITLIAGAALFGYVNGQAANSEKGIGNQYAGNINYLNEKEAISLVSFANNERQLYVWIYNIGQIPLSGFTLFVSGYMCTGSQGKGCVSPTVATFTCLYAGSCSWADSSLTPSSGTCGSLSPASTPIPESTSSSPSPPKSYLVDLTGCPGGSTPSYFAYTASPPYLYSFTIAFQGQFGSQASTTKGN